MNKPKKREVASNPFKKLLDDAGRALGDIDDLAYLEELPDDEKATVPFPYGIQPQNRFGWK